MTQWIELGALVACTSFYNPALLAKKAATVEEISGGRLILGLGAGWLESEYHAFGLPFDHRVSRFEEAFTIIRTLLRDGHIDFEGTYYQARDCELRPRGPRADGPPILIGSVSPVCSASRLGMQINGMAGFLIAAELKKLRRIAAWSIMRVRRPGEILRRWSGQSQLV